MGNEMLLLGAGASVEANIPDAKKMAREIVKRFNTEKKYESLVEAVNIVNNRLIEEARNCEGDSSIDCVDVEALYNALLLLEERNMLEITPFVESWNPEIEKIKNSEKIFNDIRFEMRRMLEDLTLITDEGQIEYLKPILNLAKRQGELFVATLNYDNAIELLAHSEKMPFDTGIKEWITKGVFNYNTHPIKLIKLHGSNYWYWTEGTRTYDQRLPHHQIRFKSHWDETLRMIVQVETIMVIFGQRNKLTAEGPFLDLLRKFDEQLQRANLLTVIGYSFRDPHINFFITKFLHQYEGNTIRIISPSFETSDVEYAKDLRYLRDQKGKVEVVEKYTGEALKEIYGI